MSDGGGARPMTVRVTEAGLPGVLLVETEWLEDERGIFGETYSRAAFRAAGILCDFVQDNQSLSRRAGTVRGLHFQTEPAAQDKLIRVLRGAVFDVCVDVRPASPTFRRFVAVELRAEAGRQLFVPRGFAHGFCTLVPDTEVFYKCSAHYAHQHERAILWCDPDLAIPWPIRPEEAFLSERDRRSPRLAELLGG